MAFQRIDGKTPNGGDYSEMHFLNDKHEEVPREEATQFMIRECKMDGTLISTVYGRM